MRGRGDLLAEHPVDAHALARHASTQRDIHHDAVVRHVGVVARALSAVDLVVPPARRRSRVRGRRDATRFVLHAIRPGRVDRDLAVLLAGVHTARRVRGGPSRHLSGRHVHDPLPRSDARRVGSISFVALATVDRGEREPARLHRGPQRRRSHGHRDRLLGSRTHVDRHLRLLRARSSRSRRPSRSLATPGCTRSRPWPSTASC